ncbi:MAG: response regulator [Sphingobacteriales bacterium]|nr:MAG: response regulator [Sphingobacteriales bacterium]
MDNRIKICIVEDEALIADEIRRTLEGLGYEVSGIYYDFETAAAAIPNSDADLFMLDINLGGRPEENGIQLAGLLKSGTPKPFIFLTAYSDPETVTRATALHPANYLIKPINPAALFAALQLAIAQSQEPDADMAQPISAYNRPNFFFVKIGPRKAKLYWRDAYCMESSKNYVRVYMKGHTSNYPVRGTLSFVLDQLVPKAIRDQFFRLGRSICLNRTHVTDFNEERIVCGDRVFENAGRIEPGQYPSVDSQPA